MAAESRTFDPRGRRDFPLPVKAMSERQRRIPAQAPRFPPLAAWVRRSPDQAPSFFSGAALSALDPVARNDHPIGALWRQRLALKCAAALMLHLGRSEGEAAIRDQLYLARSGAQPGPAGQVFACWLELTRPGLLRDRGLAARLTKRFELPASATGSLEDIVAGMPAGQGNPVQAAAEIALIGLRLFPQSRHLAPWLADAVVAGQLRWPAPVPLLAARIKRPDLRHATSDADGWLRACHDAYAAAAADAIDLYADLARRAERLIDAAPKLRSHEADRIVARLLSEDALSAEAGKATSERSVRRLFDRLVELGAVRELTGRSTFRLYGI